MLQLNTHPSSSSNNTTALLNIITHQVEIEEIERKRDLQRSMASGSKQLKASLLVVAALLLLICTCTTRGQAARPEPGSKDGQMPQRAVSATVSGNEKSGSAAGVEMHLDEPEEMRECEGGDDEREECLMRRTLVAHTDYIYTQGKHN